MQPNVEEFFRNNSRKSFLASEVEAALHESPSAVRAELERLVALGKVERKGSRYRFRAEPRSGKRVVKSMEDLADSMGVSVGVVETWAEDLKARKAAEGSDEALSKLLRDAESDDGRTTQKKGRRPPT